MKTDRVSIVAELKCNLKNCYIDKQVMQLRLRLAFLA